MRLAIFPKRKYEAANASQSLAFSISLTGTDGAIAQLGERLHGMQEVSGSIPLSSTKFFHDEPSETKRTKETRHFRKLADMPNKLVVKSAGLSPNFWRFRVRVSVAPFPRPLTFPAPKERPTMAPVTLPPSFIQF